MDIKSLSGRMAQGGPEEHVSEDEVISQEERTYLLKCETGAKHLRKAHILRYSENIANNRCAQKTCITQND